MDKLIQQIELFNGYALIQSIKESAGKFELPDSADKKPQKGKVIIISKNPDISEGGTIYRCQAKIGQTVYYRNWGSELFDLNGKDYVVARFRDLIMGIK